MSFTPDIMKKIMEAVYRPPTWLEEAESIAFDVTSPAWRDGMSVRMSLVSPNPVRDGLFTRVDLMPDFIRSSSKGAIAAALRSWVNAGGTQLLVLAMESERFHDVLPLAESVLANEPDAMAVFVDAIIEREWQPPHVSRMEREEAEFQRVIRTSTERSAWNMADHLVRRARERVAPDRK